jgi:hypothetical protein
MREPSALLYLDIATPSINRIQENWLRERPMPGTLSDIDVQRQIQLTHMNEALFCTEIAELKDLEKSQGAFVHCEDTFVSVVKKESGDFEFYGPERLKESIEEQLGLEGCDYIDAEGAHDIEKLHWLYRHDELILKVDSSDAARAFKNSDDPVTFLQIQQISAINREDPALGFFKDGPTESAYANGVVGKIRPGYSVPSLPISKDEAEGLTESDYSALLRLMAQNFKDNPISELTFNCFDIEPLQALSGFSEGACPVEVLQLNLSGLSDVEQEKALFHIKLAMVHLKATGLKALKIEGLTLEDSHLKSVQEVVEHYHIDFDISLPKEYQSKDYQRKIDELTAEQQFVNLTAQSFKSPTVDSSRVVRSRVKGSEILTVDVEIEQEVQVQVATDVSPEIAGSDELEAAEKNWNTFDDFFNIVNDEASPFCNLPRNRASLTSMWGNWFGEFKDTSPKILVSDEALNYLVEHQDQLDYGLGFIHQFGQFDNLPAGFSVSIKDDVPHLDFNKHLAKVLKGEKLSLKFDDSKKPKMLPSWVNRWVEANGDHPFSLAWKTIQEPYNKTANEFLRSHFLQIGRLPHATADLFFSLCDGEGGPDVKKMQMLLEVKNLNPSSPLVLELFNEKSDDVRRFLDGKTFDLDPSVATTLLNSLPEGSILLEKASEEENLDAWMNLILVKGLQSVEPALLHKDEISTLIKRKCESYQTLTHPLYDEKLAAYQRLAPDEKALFMYLFEQHLDYNPAIDFVDLFECFVDFKKQLEMIDPKLKLPTALSSTEVKNMPLALSRILAIVKNARADDRQSQLDVAMGLNLSSRGGIAVLHRKRSRDQRWHFVTPDMGFEGPNPIGRSPENDSFLRRAAFQISGQTASMAFLQKVESDVARAGWSEESQGHFLALMLGGLTGDRRPADEAKAMKHYKTFFGHIHEPPRPGGRLAKLAGINDDDMRFEVLGFVMGLANKPSLAVTSHLIKLVAGSLSTVASVAINKGKLIKAANELNIMTGNDVFGSRVYDSMRHYQDSDYEDKDLFYTHLATLKEFSKYVSLESEPMDMQTFNMAHFLVPLSSLFRIKKENVNDLMGFIKDGLDDGRLDFARFSEFCLIMKNVLPDKASGLEVSVLREMIEASCSVGLTSPVIDYFRKEEGLSERFDSSYLENYGSRTVSSRIARLIENSFPENKEQITDIIQQFNQGGDSSYHGTVVGEMRIMCEGLTSWQRNQLVRKLHQYRDRLHLGKKLEEDHSFHRMLKSINVDRFDAVIGLFEAIGSKTPDLLPDKVSLFLNDILPKFREGEFVLTELELMPLIHRLVLQAHDDEIEELANDIEQVVTTLSEMVAVKTSIRPELLKMIGEYVIDKPLSDIKNFVSKVEFLFDGLTENETLAFCMHFNGDKDLGAEELEKFYDDFKESPHLRTIALIMLNNDKGDIFSDDFKSLRSVNPEHLKWAYKSPPYPSLTQFLGILKESSKEALEEEKIESGYNELILEKLVEFDLEPAKREVSNGFKMDEAKKQMAQFKGFSLSEDDLENFNQEVQDARALSTSDLKAALHVAGTTSKNYHKLVACSAELLYRSCGIDGRLGSSMEINTTQYLAILSSLINPNACVTSQIATGEGKSRIMMISNVCQWAMGTTVDFVTSDVQLAMRDYVEYQAFFDMVGAEISLITAQSNPRDYKLGGINFSDPANLSLFRNKAKSQGIKSIQDSDPLKRVLMLDEADKLFFDSANTRFNYSSSVDMDVGDMTWVYSVLMSYFDQSEDALRIYYSDIDKSREDFLSFAAGHCDPDQVQKLRAISHQQIEQWQVSAVTAASLKYNHDFVISSDELVATSSGPKISSQANLLVANRVAKGSKLSFGVHQCLHARLNAAKNGLREEKDSGLKARLEECSYDFSIEDEKKIIYSSTSKNLMDDYTKGGKIRGVTGTVGSIIERQELDEIYGMSFVEVPRANKLMRYDNDMQLLQDEDQQIKALIDNIRVAQAKGQPILVICENDEESEKLFGRLRAVFSDDVSRVHSQLSSTEENALVKKAGIAGNITVSTDMIGRGTDFRLESRTRKDGSILSVEEGLHVMTTYLPKVRDLEQIIGRSGRFGKKGESSLLIDKKRLLAKLGVDRLPDHFSRNVNAFIAQEHLKMARKDQVERVIKNDIGDFRAQLQDKFFSHLPGGPPSKESIAPWMDFVDTIDQKWNEKWPNIQSLLQGHPEIDKIDDELKLYHSDVKTAWGAMIGSMKDLSVFEAVSMSEILEIPDLNVSDVSQRVLKDVSFMMDTKAPTVDEKAPAVDEKASAQQSKNYQYLLAGVFGFVGASLAFSAVITGLAIPLLGLVATYVTMITVGAMIGSIFGAIIGKTVDQMAGGMANKAPEPEAKIAVEPTCEYRKTVDQMAGGMANKAPEPEAKIAVEPTCEYRKAGSMEGTLESQKSVEGSLASTSGSSKLRDVEKRLKSTSGSVTVEEGEKSELSEGAEHKDPSVGARH